MKKTSFKSRVVSAFLAITLISALLPGGIIAAAVDREPVTLNLIQGYAGSDINAR